MPWQWVAYFSTVCAGVQGTRVLVSVSKCEYVAVRIREVSDRLSLSAQVLVPSMGGAGALEYSSYGLEVCLYLYACPGHSGTLP